MSDHFFGQLINGAVPVARGPPGSVFPAVGRLPDSGIVGTLAPVGSDEKEEMK